MNDRHLDGVSIRRVVAQWLLAQPSVAYAVAKDDLATVGELAGYARPLRLSYYPERSGDVVFLLKPYQVMTEEPTGTSHAQPYAYDNQVPLAFLGRSVHKGTFHREVHPVDLVPTLASLLGIGFPAQVEGRPLEEPLAFGP